MSQKQTLLKMELDFLAFTSKFIGIHNTVGVNKFYLEAECINIDKLI